MANGVHDAWALRLTASGVQCNRGKGNSLKRSQLPQARPRSACRVTAMSPSWAGREPPGPGCSGRACAWGTLLAQGGPSLCTGKTLATHANVGTHLACLVVSARTSSTEARAAGAVKILGWGVVGGTSPGPGGAAEKWAGGSSA